MHGRARDGDESPQRLGMNTTREVGDLAAAMTAFGAVLDFLPAIAAGISIIWYLARFAVWIGKRWKFLE